MGPQNIYDDPEFFAGYARLPRSEVGLSAVFEWPAFQRLLPGTLRDTRVLDLGCGLGYLAREARDSGLVLVRLEEPEAEAALLAERPALREERRRPPFLLLAADRPR